MSGERPAKAYHVEEVWRTVASFTVYAHNYEDAKRRLRELDPENVETNDLISNAQPTGAVRVRRLPSDDRKETNSNA